MPRKYTVERIVMTLLQLMPDSKTIGTNTCFQIGARQVQIYRTHAGRLTVWPKRPSGVFVLFRGRLRKTCCKEGVTAWTNYDRTTRGTDRVRRRNYLWFPYHSRQQWTNRLRRQPRKAIYRSSKRRWGFYTIYTTEDLLRINCSLTNSCERQIICFRLIHSEMHFH